MTQQIAYHRSVTVTETIVEEAEDQLRSERTHHEEDAKVITKIKSSLVSDGFRKAITTYLSGMKDIQCFASHNPRYCTSYPVHSRKNIDKSFRLCRKLQNPMFISAGGKDISNVSNFF